MAEASVQLNFRISPELNKLLETHARQTNIAKTEIVKLALEAYLKK